MPDISVLYPEYRSTARLDELRESEYGVLDSDDHVYLDYTGSGLAAAAQIRHHQERLSRTVYGNPHSASPTSAAATETVEQTRARILDHLNASPDEYTVIFTPNASGAARLVGEAYPFGRGSRFVLTADNHNSINGLREFARAAGAKMTYIPVRRPELRVDNADVVSSLPRKGGLMSRLVSGCRTFVRGSSRAKSKGLFAYPAQSNFTGVRHPLSWVSLAQERGYRVLLDAAAFLPTATLDLSTVKPDFVIISWYKLFGYPTGVGCLVARRDSLECLRLRRPWFSGGTVQAATVSTPWHMLAQGAEAFEDGTVNFLSIPDVHFGLDWLAGIGIPAIGTRVKCLTGWFLQRLLQLRHSDGSPMVRVYGPTDLKMRGGTVAFNLLDAAGKVVDERLVAMESAAARISLRTGCFCNPGAGEAALGLDPRLVRNLTKLAGARGFSGGLDEFVTMVGMSSYGAIRVSFGLASTTADVDKFFGFVDKTYKDRVTTPVGLPRREQC
ncbi:molybdenum cofactor sulfurase [Staphylotrichum tortipilum]|uniref:Molybdenum cofactor sulfurase n=1 Tax=Staphylotrichum tortipilum TaxID=2831512 RepID=A0AAN6MT70_9PEZI|nr:molybdenum cofactor sulfurase [Staphylotrichum longicolle]